MKRLDLVAYEYRDGLDEGDFRDLTRKFAETGPTPNVIAHYERLDGRGGFIVQEMGDEREESDYGDERMEDTLRYGRWMKFEVIPVTTMDEAFSVIQRVFG